MRLTKLLRGLDGFADDKWVSAGGGGAGVLHSQSARGRPRVPRLLQERRSAGTLSRCSSRDWKTSDSGPAGSQVLSGWAA